MAISPPSRVLSQQRWRHWGIATLYFFLPIIVWVFTSLPLVGRSTPFVAVALLAFLLIVRFLPQVPRPVVVVLCVVFVLCLVGSSGWFFSPFFFTLYLAAIALGFMYTPLVATAFTIALLVIFASSVGEVSPTADFLTLVSLLAVIPITIVLRKSFLLVQQEKRGILILESEDPVGDLTSLDSVLSNQVNRISIVLRQPITYIRQALALLKDDALTKEEYPVVIHRMSRAADEVFTLVKEFESATTKNKLLSRQDKEETP